MSAEHTREIMTAYLKEMAERGPYGRHLAADVTWTTIGTDQVVTGREAVEQFIRSFHEQAFDANPRFRVTLIGDGQAALEADFIGTHTGEFLGVAPTGRAVNVPYAVFYDLRDGAITALRGHISMELLRRQITAPQMAGARA